MVGQTRQSHGVAHVFGSDELETVCLLAQHLRRKEIAVTAFTLLLEAVLRLAELGSDEQVISVSVFVDDASGVEHQRLIVQRYNGRNVSINLGKVDTVLTEAEQVKGEYFQPTERIKLYVVEVKDTTKGPKITISRTHPELVKRLFEYEVAEVRDGTVEICSISREAGSRTKIAVRSNHPDVDPVGACVGVNGSRVGAVVAELRGEKIDIVNWNEDPAIAPQVG